MHRSQLHPDPIRQFAAWFFEAEASGLKHPNAMTLATADVEGRPSARMILLKGVDARGFVFYTSYESSKARDLAANPYAALVFYWEPLERQVRISGTVERVPPEESIAYFGSRPRGSQLGAWASGQSSPVEDQDVLEKAFVEAERRFAGREVPIPPAWGGYVLAPDRLEFWQGRPNRLHDRFLYTRGRDGSWTVQRLAP